MKQKDNYLTTREASEKTGIPQWKLAEAVRRGLIPSYTFLNSRQYVLEQDIKAAIKFRPGGLA